MSDEVSFSSLLRNLARERPRRAHLGLIADLLLRASGGERVFIVRFRSQGGFRTVVARNVDEEDLSRPGRAISHFALRRMEESGEPWAVSEARRDRRYRSEEVLEGARPARSILVLPLWSEGRLAGAAYLDHRFRVLDPKLIDKPEVRHSWHLAEIAFRLQDERTRTRGIEKRTPLRELGRGIGVAEVAGVPRPIPALELARGTAVDFFGFISANPDLQDTFDQLRQLADSTLAVLITGETGVGKSLLARALHRASSRSDGPLEVLACGAVPETLFESELLGHKRGAFTGAEQDRPGLFQLADGGTLVLDEVGELSAAAQTKLLRVLADGRVRPIGGAPADALPVDVRIVASTRHDLDQRVLDGSFRADLYFRLKSVVLPLQPLCDRPEDIVALAELFLERYTRDRSTHFSDAALERFLRYSWPGNVRELENEVRRIATLGEGGEIEESRIVLGSHELAPLPAHRNLRLASAVEVAERRVIAQALRHCDGNKSRAAEELGITRKALYRRLRKYGLDGPTPGRGRPD